MKIWKGDTPKFGKMYAVHTGQHAGKFFIFMEQSDGCYSFLSVPDMNNHEIPKKDFDIGLENDIVEYVEKVPRYVRKTAKEQYTQNQEKGMGGSPKRL